MQTRSHSTSKDSLGRQYRYKLGANVIGLVFSAVTQSIVPRLLGPAHYGSFSFLTSFFNQVLAFFDSGSSIAFFSKLSQRREERALLRFYWGFAGMVGVTLVVVVVGVFWVGMDGWLWPDQGMPYVWLALGWGLLTWWVQILNRMVDGYGLTVRGEIARLQQQALGLMAILLMVWFARSTLADFFAYQYCLLTFLFLAWWIILRRYELPLFPSVPLTINEVGRYSREFWDYSAPLISYAIVGMLVGVMDRWLLQRFAGSIGQAFFALSSQISTVCFLFSGAMTPLLLREMSWSYGQGDIARMRAMFLQYIPMLYSIAAFLGIFLSVQARAVVFLVGGSSFTDASGVVAVMALFPIHQTYGQLSGTVFYATGQTETYRNIGITFMLVGLVVTVWLVAPTRFLGLQLGATGLALKMVVMQALAVNVQLWWNDRLLQLSFWKLVLHQLYSLAMLAGIAWGADFFVSMVVQGMIARFALSGIVYSLGCLGTLAVAPSVFGLSRGDLRNGLSQLASQLKG
jgi:O-antigen/teichoic acid export membrane protein